MVCLKPELEIFLLVLLVIIKIFYKNVTLEIYKKEGRMLDISNVKSNALVYSIRFFHIHSDAECVHSSMYYGMKFITYGLYN